MENLTMGKFNKTAAELTLAAEESKKIQVVDLKDKVQRELAKKQQHKLRDYRNDIKDQGLTLRKQANDFNKAVSKEEKKLLAIIAPEEDRLKAIEVEARLIEIRLKRVEQLPERKNRLDKIGDTVIAPNLDDDLIGLDDAQFEIYYNTRVADKNEADRLKAEEDLKIQQAELQVDIDKNAEEARKIQQAKEIAEAEENARKEEKRKAELEAERIKIEQARVEDERIKADKIAKEEAEKEAELLAKREEYIKFRKEHGWTVETKGNFLTTEKNGMISLFKKIGVFKK